MAGSVQQQDCLCMLMARGAGRCTLFHGLCTIIYGMSSGKRSDGSFPVEEYASLSFSLSLLHSSRSSSLRCSF